MIGGTTKSGSRRDFTYWSVLDVDFLQLALPYDHFLNEERVNEVLEYRDEYGLDILIHPRPDGETFLTPANPEAHDTIFNALDVIAGLIRDEGLIDKVIMHLCAYRLPGSGYASYTEKEAIENAKPFFERLRDLSGFTIVLENVFPPGIGWEEVGYLPEHFSLFDLRDDYEFCLDTGHLNLSKMKVEDVLKLPHEVSCLHLQGNNGEEDQHLPLAKSNFSEWEKVEELLNEDRYVIIEAKKGLDKVPDAVKYLRKNKIMP